MNTKVDQHNNRNLILFITSYIISNLAGGVLYDTYINYLQEVAPSIATSFWAFYGYATFISAAILVFVSKIGYKKILILSALSTSAAFFGAVYSKSIWLLYLVTILALTGVQLHYIILAPYVAAYTENLKGKEIKWYTRAYYMGYVGYLLATYLGGAIVVKVFSSLSSLSYESAKEATRFIVEMSPELYGSYLTGNKYTILAMGVLSLVALIPIGLIKESPEDYKNKEIDNGKKLKTSIKEKFAILLNRNARIYLIYSTIISFSMGLFTPYYTVFLNRILHIDKVTSSLLVSISYLAIIVFMFFTPIVVRKFGEVGTISLMMVLSVPFMMLIANGDRFGTYMVPVVGVSLFVRAGFANLSSPAESALSMKIVPKEMRPAYAAVVSFLAGIISIISGTFTGKILFTSLEGYRTAYYIAAVLYLAAGFIIFIGFKKYIKKGEA